MKVDGKTVGSVVVEDVNFRDGADIFVPNCVWHTEQGE